MSTKPDSDDALPTAINAGEQAAHAWVDEGPHDPMPPLSAPDGRRAADVTLLHALLEQALRPDPAAREIRVQRVAAAVREEVTPAAPIARPQRRRWLATLTTIAAVFLVGIALRSNFNPQTNATAAVDSALKAAQAETDRVYLVSATLGLPDGTTKALSADLWVRGGSHYVLRQDGALGDLVLGSDGREHWVVPAVGPVFTGTEPRLIEQFVLRDQLSLPFLQVATLLRRLADRYELKLGPAEEIAASPDSPGVWCTQVIGTKLDSEDRLAPEVIRLWTARQSGVAHQVEVVWKRSADQPGLQRIEMTLQPLAEALPTDWYRHEAHHASDRRVIQRGPTAATDGEL
jgi:hypothetical protein